MLSALPGSVSDVSRAPTSVRLFTGEGAAASLQEKKGSRRKTAIKVSCPETQHRGRLGALQDPGAQVCTRPARGHRALGGTAETGDSEWGRQHPDTPRPLGGGRHLGSGPLLRPVGSSPLWPGPLY